MDIIERRRNTILNVLEELPQRLDFLQNRIEINPIEDEDKKPVGLHFLYKTNSNPSGRMQVVFSQKEFNLLNIPLDVIMMGSPMDNEKIIRMINLFANHPDGNVITMVTHFIDEMQKEVYEIRDVSYREVLTYTKPDLNIDNYTGSFFPLIHMYNPLNGDIAYINIEPLVL